MVFSSLVFLGLFLPWVILLYSIIPQKYRNVFLFLVSLFFYAWGEPKYIFVMLFSTIFDYTNGLLIGHFSEQPIKKKFILVLSIFGNLGILCFFKYTDFIITNINALFHSQISLLSLALPIGISFYTFQTMSYTIDVYRGRIQPQKDFIAFAMYVSLFPQLIAGPIVRYASVEQDLYARKLDGEHMAAGMQRFLIGLGKKVLLANQIGAVWDEISSNPDMTTVGAWLGAICFTFQIYFDFSGYSDMAIGLGRIFGFHFPENFAHPYEAKSITEFWRRWHMTLSGWFREYLYIPLGGNQKGKKRQILNLAIVWILTGLWHGASWNFVIWGVYYFILLVFEKLFLAKRLDMLQDWLAHVYTMVFVVIGWAIFANENTSGLVVYLSKMFGLRGQFIDSATKYHIMTVFPFLFLLTIASTQYPRQWIRFLWRRKILSRYPSLGGERTQQIKFLLISLYTCLLLVLSLAFLVNGSYNPFLYFRF